MFVTLKFMNCTVLRVQHQGLHDVPELFPPAIWRLRTNVVRLGWSSVPDAYLQ